MDVGDTAAAAARPSPSTRRQDRAHVRAVRPEFSADGRQKRVSCRLAGGPRRCLSFPPCADDKVQFLENIRPVDCSRQNVPRGAAERAGEGYLDTTSGGTGIE